MDARGRCSGAKPVRVRAAAVPHSSHPGVCGGVGPMYLRVYSLIDSTPRGRAPRATPPRQVPGRTASATPTGAARLCEERSDMWVPRIRGLAYASRP
eukprot:281510-Prymnesium_polylepis.1